MPGLVAARERYLREYAPELASGPTCSIVLPAANGVEATRDCLIALSQTAGDVSFELIVVDDATSDDTAELLSHVGGDVTVRYGRIGTNGQTQSKSFADEAAAEKHADKLIAEKTAKGYVEVS